MKFSGPVLDAPDVRALARFYAELLGWEVQELYDKWGVVRPAERTQGHKIELQHDDNFVRPVWPSAPGQQGMQIHLDWWVEDLERGVAWAIDCGAQQAEWQPENRDLSRLRIMLDPAGHPFCLWT